MVSLTYSIQKGKKCTKICWFEKTMESNYLQNQTEKGEY